MIPLVSLLSGTKSSPLLVTCHVTSELVSNDTLATLQERDIEVAVTDIALTTGCSGSGTVQNRIL